MTTRQRLKLVAVCVVLLSLSSCTSMMYRWPPLPEEYYATPDGQRFKMGYESQGTCQRLVAYHLMGESTKSEGVSPETAFHANYLTRIGWLAETPEERTALLESYRLGFYWQDFTGATAQVTRECLRTDKKQMETYHSLLKTLSRERLNVKFLQTELSV
jgi:hypothetical protein